MSIVPQRAVPDKYGEWFRMFRGGMRRRVTVGEVPVRFDESRAFLRVNEYKKKRTGNGSPPLLPMDRMTGERGPNPVRGNILKVLKRVRGRRKVRAVSPCRRVFPAMECVKRILKNGRNRNISRGVGMCDFVPRAPAKNKKAGAQVQPLRSASRAFSGSCPYAPAAPVHVPRHDKGFRQDLYQRKPAISL